VPQIVRQKEERCMSETFPTPSRPADPGVLGWARRHRFVLLSAAGLLLTIVVLWLPTG
jgi:hypothetical protein